MSARPLAYLLTFCTYGSWLHGRPGGSVDRHHNEFGEPLLPHQPIRFASSRERMRHAGYRLDTPARRRGVIRAMVATCRRRGALLLAGQSRIEHVHVVCQTDEDPLDFIARLKSGATWHLRRYVQEKHPTCWAEGGSRKYLWTPEMVIERIHYVLNEQGLEMERYVHPDYEGLLKRGRYRRG